MNLNRIAKELLEEKRAHARTRSQADSKPPPVKKTGKDTSRLFQGALKLPDRTCETCGRSFNRRRYKSGKLEGPSEYGQRRFCPEHTSYKNGGGARCEKPLTPSVPFDPATRLPDPRPLQTLSDNPKNESNMKRLPSLLEAERASGVKHEPVTIEQFKCTARRAKRLHPEFAAMLGGQEVA